MKVTTSGRGFKHLDPIIDGYGGRVFVYESSAAMEPCLWVRIVARGPAMSTVEAHSHLTIDQAEELISHLRYIIDHHYQNETPSV